MEKMITEFVLLMVSSNKMVRLFAPLMVWADSPAKSLTLLANTSRTPTRTLSNISRTLSVWSKQEPSSIVIHIVGGLTPPSSTGPFPAGS